MEETLRVVLLRRDEDPAGRRLTGLLSRSGVRVVEVRSAEEIVRLPAGGVDLLILADPPEGSDREAVIRRLRAEPALSGVPLLSLQGESKGMRRDALFDALGDGVAVLDRSGRIARYNQAMASLMGLDVESAQGRDFFHPSAGLPPGSRTTCPGTLRREVVEWSRGDRTFRVTAAPLSAPSLGTDAPDDGGILVVATDITARSHLGRRAAAESEAAEPDTGSRTDPPERDARLLRQVTAEAHARGHVPAQAAEPLRTAHPEAFRELIVAYEDLLERVLDRLTYRISDPLSEPLRELAGRLGRLGAGPRDVVELHGMALRHKTAGVASTKARALADEGRLLVLELMGHLVSHYRHQGGGPAGASSTQAPRDDEARCDRPMSEHAVRNGPDAPPVADGDRRPPPES